MKKHGNTDTDHPPSGLFSGFCLAVHNLRSPLGAFWIRSFSALVAGAAAVFSLWGIARVQNPAAAAESSGLLRTPLVVESTSIPSGDLSNLAASLVERVAAEKPECIVRPVRNIEPMIYLSDVSEGVTEVSGPENPQWKELPSEQVLLENSWELVSGRWPSAKDEAAVLLNNSGEADAGCLNALGFTEEETSQWNRNTERFFRKTFRVVKPEDCWIRNADGTVGYAGNDPECMKSVVASSLTIKVTGVLLPREDMPRGAVGYMSSLTEWLAEEGAPDEETMEELADYADYGRITRLLVYTPDFATQSVVEEWLHAEGLPESGISGLLNAGKDLSAYLSVLAGRVRIAGLILSAVLLWTPASASYRGRRETDASFGRGLRFRAYLWEWFLSGALPATVGGALAYFTGII